MHVQQYMQVSNLSLALFVVIIRTQAICKHINDNVMSCKRQIQIVMEKHLNVCVYVQIYSSPSIFCHCLQSYKGLFLIFCALTPLDIPLVAFIATEESIWHFEHDVDSSGHEYWDLHEEKALEIPGATALDVDIVEKKIYWINLSDKVGTVYMYMYMYK